MIGLLRDPVGPLRRDIVCFVFVLNLWHIQSPPTTDVHVHKKLK